MPGPRILSLFLVSALSLGLATCGKKEAAKETAKPAAVEAVMVTTSKVTKTHVTVPDCCA
jgi:ABC-type uncharacterized transport system auxiliary subunit